MSIEMEKSLAADDDDKHQITINKSKMDIDVAAEGKKTMNGAFDGKIENEPKDGTAGRVELEYAAGSSRDMRIEPTFAPLPAIEFKDAPEPVTDRRLKTPTREKAKKRSNTGVHDEQPFTTVCI